MTRSAMIKVGELPWEVVVSANGKMVYVANPDSNSVSVIDAADRHGEPHGARPGEPDTLGVTPNGQQLWVGEISSAS